MNKSRNDMLEKLGRIDLPISLYLFICLSISISLSIYTYSSIILSFYSILVFLFHILSTVFDMNECIALKHQCDTIPSYFLCRMQPKSLPTRTIPGSSVAMMGPPTKKTLSHEKKIIHSIIIPYILVRKNGDHSQPYING